MKKLVLASSNPGKLREFRELFAPLGIELIGQAELGISDTEEPHPTFVENALAKARHASRHSGFPAFADDSGICVDILRGAPGVQSARYAGAPPSDTDGGRAKQDARNNRKLLAALSQLGALSQPGRRKAHYTCVIVLVRRPEDPEPMIAEARWQGEVIEEPRGANGFGYDPYFLLPELGRTAAELDPQEKNTISHRGRALARLVAQLRAAGEVG